MVLGNSLNDQIDEIWTSIMSLKSIVLGISNEVSKLTGLLAVHSHIAAPLVGGPVSPSPTMVINASISTAGQIKEKMDIIGEAINTVISKINKLEPFETSITSDFHKLN